MTDKTDVTQAQEVPSNKAEPAATDAVASATAPLNQRIAALEKELSSKVEEMEKHKALLTEKEKGITALSTDKENAVKAYMALVQKSNPLVPGEMISGASIIEINTSLEKANALVTQIRSGLEKELQITRVPPGAPGRTEPDTSSMTAREKISYGLSNVRKNKQ